jgi:beta-glucosidase
LETAYASGKPVVLLILSGSALAVDWADEHIPAIMQCWYPGAQGGLAVANVLFGEKNPQGKLPVTFYRADEPFAEFTDYNMAGRTYRYMKTKALYPFGYGLSYTKFTYSALASDTEALTEDGVTVSVQVENQGDMPGVETVQVYIKIDQADAPNFQLKGITKVALAAGETTQVTFTLPKEAFGLYDQEGILRYAQNTATIYVGGQCPDDRSAELTGQTVENVTITL